MPNQKAQLGRETPASHPSAATLRALASPVRLAILQFLGVSDSATTGECADVAGVAAGSASYHLRQLEGASLVEQVPSADRRERRWRLAVAPSLTVGHPGAAGITAEELQFRAAADDRERNIVDEYLDAETSLPEEWRDAAHIQDIIRLTADEFHELNATLSAVIEQYRMKASGRADDEGKLVYVSIQATPWVKADAVQAARRPSVRE